MPGWFNPHNQPQRRQAFLVTQCGNITVCPDDPNVVRARKEALDIRFASKGAALNRTPPKKTARPTLAQKLPSTPAKMSEKRGRQEEQGIDFGRRLGHDFKVQRFA